MKDFRAHEMYRATSPYLPSHIVLERKGIFWYASFYEAYRNMHMVRGLSVWSAYKKLLKTTNRWGM